MEILFYVFFFFLGSAFASFMNVLVFGEDSVRRALKRKKSRCDNCGQKLVWWELIPVLSWLFLYGRCSKCKKPIPLYHPITEVFLGIIFLSIYHYFQSDVALLYGYLLFISVIYFFSIYDIEKGIVPNRWIIPVTGVTLIGIVIVGLMNENSTEFLGMRILSAVGYGLFFVLMNGWSKSGLMPGVKKGKQGFGWGDAKFAPFLGLVLGSVGTLVSGWVGIVSGAIVGILISIRIKVKDQPKAGSPLANLRIPYVPFMAFGAWVAILWGDVIFEYISNLLVI